MIKLNLNAPQIDETKVIAPHSIGIWFTQAHSCQRDLVLAAKQMRSDFPIHIIASHQDLRPEITSAADIALQEPILSERVEWVLEQAQRLQVKLIVAGRFGRIYLEQKHRFDALGIRLMAGCDTAENVGQLHDKSAFTQICTEHDIPVVPATTVETADQLQTAYDEWSAQGDVCVKPVTGVFASGFWRLDPNATPFDMFHNSQNFKAHPQTFIESYRQLTQTPAYLVMPFLSGHECSVDMFCVHGEVRYAVARYKHRGDYQTLTLDDPAIDLGRRVARLFHCDGLVNMQARYNHVGELYILEVNPRPSGGISHTFHSGVNLVVALISEFLEHEYQAEVMSSNITVRNISQSLQV